MSNSFSWIKIYRKFSEWEWHDVPNMVSVWVHLLILANFEDKQWHDTIIERGQIVIGLESFSKTIGVTVQELRTCIKRLCNSNMITTKSTNKYTIITICNYDKYQSCEDVSWQTNNKQTTTETQSSNTQSTTTKEYKNIRSKEVEKRDTDVSLKKFSFKNELIALGVDEQVANDWIMVRKNKKLSQTQTAFNHTKKNIETISSTHNLSANEIIRTAVERSWGGVEPDFFKNIPAKGQQDLFSPIQNESYSPAGIKYQ